MIRNQRTLQMMRHTLLALSFATKPVSQGPVQQFREPYFGKPHAHFTHAKKNNREVLRSFGRIDSEQYAAWYRSTYGIAEDEDLGNVSANSGPSNSRTQAGDAVVLEDLNSAAIEEQLEELKLWNGEFDAVRSRQ